MVGVPGLFGLGHVFARADPMLFDFPFDPIFQIGKAEKGPHDEEGGSYVKKHGKIHLYPHNDQNDHQNKGKGKHDDRTPGDLRSVQVFVG